VRVFGRMGRGEEEVLGVSTIKRALQGLHCEVKGMGEGLGHTEQLHGCTLHWCSLTPN